MKSSQAISITPITPVTPISSGSLATRLDRVRGGEAAAPSAVWEPTGPAAMPAAPVAIPGEAAMIAVIVGPLAVGEGHQDGLRKERDLMALFDALSPVQALEVRRRLSAMRAGDPLAAAFSRLVVERRGRLLAFLDDTRRRRARR